MVAWSVQPSTIYRPNYYGNGPRLQSMSEEGPELAVSSRRNTPQIFRSSYDHPLY